jgi:hypothetical protein
MDAPNSVADPAILLAEADKEAKKPAHRQGFLETLAAAKDRFFDNLAGIPEVPVSTDHTAQIRTNIEYTVLLDKTTDSLCTFFYRGSDPQNCKLKDEVTGLARSLNGKTTFALVNYDDSKQFVESCALTNKLPAFAIANKNCRYIHLYTSKSDTTSFKELIDLYERGERKKED